MYTQVRPVPGENDFNEVVKAKWTTSIQSGQRVLCSLTDSTERPFP